MENGVETPIFNSCSPGSLKQLAKYKLADTMVSSCQLVVRMSEMTDGYDESKHYYAPSLQLDNTIMFNMTYRETKMLMARLKLLKSLWESPEWLGGHEFPLRQEVFQAFSAALNYSLITPAYKLLLQVLFCQVAGGYKPRQLAELDEDKVYIFEKLLCPGLNRFLKELAPFKVKELDTHRMIFENPTPLVTLVKHSPNLKVVHFFHQDYTDSNDIIKQGLLPVLKQMSRCSQKLEVLRADYVGDCDQYLYKTFFQGMTKAAVLRAVNSREKINQSFPALRRVHMWNRKPAPHLFLHVLLHVYPRLESISTQSFRGVSPSFFSSPKPHFSSVQRSPCNLRGISFESCSDFSLPDSVVKGITTFYPKINHVTLNGMQQPMPESPATIGKKIKSIVTKFDINSLSIFSIGYIYINFDLSIYSDAISAVGEKLTCLNLHLMNMDGEMFYDILDHCTQLQSLKISIQNFGVEARQMRLMPHLTTLETWTDSLFYDEDLLLFVKTLVNAAPNIKRLKVNSRIARNIYPVDGDDFKLQKVEQLSLVGSPYCMQVGPEVLDDNSMEIGQFINTLPALQLLVLYFSSVNVEIYRRNYRHTALSVVQGDKLLGLDHW